jgi:predicted kinase
VASAEPLLVVLAGRPGTGKTTLARRLAADLRAAHLRGDAIATAILRSSLTDIPDEAGEAAYGVLREVALGCLACGTSVVIDAVNATPQRRAIWPAVADSAAVRLVVLETLLSDSDEHRRRVEARRSEFAGHIPHGWALVMSQPYEPWDEARDGPRVEIDTGGPDAGYTQALGALACG